MATLAPLIRTPIIAHHLSPLIAPFSPNYSNNLHPVLSNRASNEIQTRRQKIVKEIFDTEHNYISQLNTIVTLFLKPIRLGCLLPPEAINAIFSNVEGILAVNEELFSCMRQRSLGEAFSYLAPFLKLYSTYANNFLLANSTVQEWMKRDADFASFISSQELRPECCSLSLQTLLITPIQRIPRYKLLLEDLLRHTKTTHTDYSQLSAASAQIAAVASHINEHIRQHENFSKMLAIQSSLTGPCIPGILAPGRRFIQEGRLQKVCRRRAKERMVFLFSDILIYARTNLLDKKEGGSSYECRCVLPLLSSTVCVLPHDARTPGVEALFQVSNEDTSLLFYTHSKDEVYQWAQTIEDAITDLQQTFGAKGSGAEAVEVSLEHPLTPSSSGILQTPASPYPLTATIFSRHSAEEEEEEVGPPLDSRGGGGGGSHPDSTLGYSNAHATEQEEGEEEGREVEQALSERSAVHRVVSTGSLSTMYSTDFSSRCCHIL